MSLRTKSRTMQWGLWLGALLVSIALYVIISQILFGAVSFDLLVPRHQRLFLPIVALFALVAWETRWDGIVREGSRKKEEVRSEVPGATAAPITNSQPPTTFSPTPTPPLPPTPSPYTFPLHLPPTPTPSPPQPAEELSGEELYIQARSMPHQGIPDLVNDGDYLKLLGQAAAKGFPRAYLKLGDYAMRRGTLVESYYWLSMAKRNGVPNLDALLREIRKNWALLDFPAEASNVNPIFTEEAGSIGRAFLSIDAGHDAYSAKKFLKATHPEFLTDCR